MKTPKLLLLVALLTGFASSASAQITPSPIYTDGMVIQQKTDAAIWGDAPAATHITIIASWAPSDTIRTFTAPGGHWSAMLRTPPADGKLHTIRINDLVIKDVKLGEVWLCSGQSNMQWSVESGIKNGETEAAAANNPNIHIYQIPLLSASTPQSYCNARWSACTPQTMRKTSAVGYFFARNLEKSLGVPVGIIVSAWGGTIAEVWTPAELVTLNPRLAQNVVKNSNQWWPDAPGSLYNQMINPIAPAAIAGAIWYQGESNVSRAAAYTTLMQNLVWGWRQRFDRQFPFYIVQIAPFNYNTGNNNAADLRAAQERFAATTPAAGMVVVSDLVDDVNNIHPIDKQNVGLRLANMALAEVYGKPIKDYRSPTAATATADRGTVTVTFNNATPKLLVRTKGTDNGIIGLQVADHSGKFYPATGFMKGNKLTVSATEVTEPTTVAYCYDDTTIGNIFSESGLPVAPFKLQIIK